MIKLYSFRLFQPLCGFIGFLMLTLLLSMSAGAGQQADRAIFLVKSLIDKGEIEQDASIRLAVKRGNITNFLGEGYALKAEWEQLTGTYLDVRVIPQLASRDLISTAQDIDITIARNREYPDLFTDGLILDLTPFLERFNFSLNKQNEEGYLLPQLQATFDGKVVALPADGDVALLYLRRDLLEDSGNRERFKKQFGYDLQLPETWDQYLKLVRFFNAPDRGFYGALEPRDELTAWMYWMPRYSSQASPNQYLFDEKMRPLIDSPAGINATESFIKTIPYSPPEILKPENDYSYTLPFFSAGKGFSTIITLAGAKLFNLDDSAVKGKFIVAPIPGSQVGGKLVRRTTLIYGNNLVVPKNSSQPLLAFLYGMWLTDPDVSKQTVGVRSGFMDPFRSVHLRDARIVQIYTKEALNAFYNELSRVVPAGTGLPGDTEYIQELNRNLLRAARGEVTSAQAMRETAIAWDRITDQHGRTEQINYWGKVRQLYSILE